MAKAKAEITISKIIDIERTTRYYLLQSSTASAPSKPTTNPPGGSWSTTEPSYTNGSTSTLYFVDLTVMSDDSFSYSAVSKSSSYEAAKAAYNKASNVEKTVTDFKQTSEGWQMNWDKILNGKNANTSNYTDYIVFKDGAIKLGNSKSTKTLEISNDDVQIYSGKDSVASFGEHIILGKPLKEDYETYTEYPTQFQQSYVDFSAGALKMYAMYLASCMDGTQPGYGPNGLPNFQVTEPGCVFSLSTRYVKKSTGDYQPFTDMHINGNINVGGSIRASSFNGHTCTIGTVTCTSKANTPTVTHVNFPKAFASAPIVLLNPLTAVPGTIFKGCSATNITTTGFDLYVTRTDNGNTSIKWIAIT